VILKVGRVGGVGLEWRVSQFLGYWLVQDSSERARDCRIGEQIIWGTWVGLIGDN